MFGAVEVTDPDRARLLLESGDKAIPTRWMAVDKAEAPSTTDGPDIPAR
jgi:hypothetical protein